MIKFVDLSKEPADYDNYSYAVCKCSRTMSEGIRVPRGDYNDFVRFNCPRCGEKLGLAVMGKKYGMPFAVN